MMRRWLGFLVVTVLAAAAHAQSTAPLQNFCSVGNVKAVTQGSSSTNTLQGSYPRCTVTVYLTGTATKATIYADNISTPLGNPFTAGTNGSFLFYAATGQGYDITLSGGSPIAMPAPFTLVDAYVGNGVGTAVTAVTVATANGFQGTSSGGTAPVLTVGPDSTHVIPVNTGSANTYLNQAGGYSTPAGVGSVLLAPPAHAAQAVQGPLNATALSGATINSEFTVDGVTYTTVTQAINAALAYAQTNATAATVKLGPGTYTIPAGTQFNMPTNTACIALLGSGGFDSASGGPAPTTLSVTGTVAASALTRTAGTTVTVTLATAELLRVGQEVYVGGSGDSTDFPNGSVTVASVTPSSGPVTSFTYASTGSNVSSTASIYPNLFFNGDEAKANSCTFKDLTIEANALVNHAFEFIWPNPIFIDMTSVNETLGDGIVIGEESQAAGHNANFHINRVWVSWLATAAGFTPAVRPNYGIHYRATAYDSEDYNVAVRNALIAGTWDEGADNTHYYTHNFGYPFVCSAPPCNNRATTAFGSTSSWAGDFAIKDSGNANRWVAPTLDSPAVAGADFAHANTLMLGGLYETLDPGTNFPNTHVVELDNTLGNYQSSSIFGFTCLSNPSSGNFVFGVPVPTGIFSLLGTSGCANYIAEGTNSGSFSVGGGTLYELHTNYFSNLLSPRLDTTPRINAATSVAFSAGQDPRYVGDLEDYHTWSQAYGTGSPTPIFHVTRDGLAQSYQNAVVPTVITTNTSAVTLTRADGATVFVSPSTNILVPPGTTFTISGSSDTTDFPNGTVSGPYAVIPGVGFAYSLTGANATATATVTTDYEHLSDGNGFVLASAAIASLGIVSPLCSGQMADTFGRGGEEIKIQRTDTGANTLTIIAPTTDHFQVLGASVTTFTIPVPSSSDTGSRTLMCDGLGLWYVTGGH
jgi:hypothetical protein